MLYMQVDENIPFFGPFGDVMALPRSINEKVLPPSIVSPRIIVDLPVRIPALLVSLDVLSHVHPTSAEVYAL